MTDQAAPSVSPNDVVRIKLTKHGMGLIVDYVDEFNRTFKASSPEATYRMKIPKWDDAGWLEGQFWSLMGYFGNWTNMGGLLPFERLEIKP